MKSEIEMLKCEEYKIRFEENIAKALRSLFLERMHIEKLHKDYIK